jgi:hypothetical protein
MLFVGMISKSAPLSALKTVVLVYCLHLYSYHDDCMLLSESMCLPKFLYSKDVSPSKVSEGEVPVPSSFP